MQEQPEEFMEEMAETKDLETPPQKSLKQKLFHYMRYTAWKDVVTVVVMVAFTLNFVGFRAYIPSGSMEPTLTIGQRYWVSIVGTYFRENKGLEHGDIVVFSHEEFEENLLVKRVIGLPNDVIEFVGDTIYRNGIALEEDYLKESDYFYSYYETYEVGEGELFVLGDNRNHSADSRYWQNPMVSLDNVKGEMLLAGK